MSGGLATTFSVLSKTDNQAAVRALVPALRSSEILIQEGALTALLLRRDPAGQGEILGAIPTLSQRWKYIIQQHAGCLTGAMRSAVLALDADQCRNACNAAVMFSDYDMLPTLLTALEDELQWKADLAAETLTKLVGQLYEQHARGEQTDSRSDPQWLYRHVVSCLETSVQRFGRHRRREVIEAYLILARPDNEVLNQVLNNSHHVSYLVIVDVLSLSSHEGVIKLLIDYLDNPQMPAAMPSIISNRCDLKFIRSLLHRLTGGLSDAVRQNLKRMRTISWLQHSRKMLGNLDDAAQRGLVQLMMASGVSRGQAFSVIEFVLLRGKPEGRRQAALALASFSGVDANALAMRALGDRDPQVQANVLAQLRHRGIPGILPRLAEKLDSPHLAVRLAAREALAEFSFARFWNTFDMMDEQARQSTAALVKKIDQRTVPLLSKELQSGIVSRRLRGLQIARAMDIADRVEDLIVDLMSDNDYALRAEAAACLAKCPSPAARKALQKALGDESASVREAAQKSLQGKP
jgi:hypothetical protein